MNDLIYANSFITAYMSKYMLDKARVLALIRARDYRSAAAILSQCDYPVFAGTIDDIIEKARAQTFEMFREYCPDPAISDCVIAIYEFNQKNHESLKQAEKELADKINQNCPRIKYEKIRLWFQMYLNAFNNSQKIPENQLFNLARDMRMDIDQPGLLFYWYILKQSEFAAVKTILLGRQFNLDREKILDNLRGLYDRF